METPYFNALMSQFDSMDQAIVMNTIYSMMTNTRQSKHVVIQGESPSGKSTFVKLIKKMMSIKAATLFPHAFWGESLVEKGLHNSGVSCWIQQPKNIMVWLESEEKLFQKPIISKDPNRTVLQKLRYLAPLKTNLLRYIPRLCRPTIGFKDWQAPILITTTDCLNVDPNQFHVVKMKRINNVDADFSQHLLQEVAVIQETFKMEA
jgi:energy-coupling factor transporter ATP-binding protein EcfA2